MFVGRKKLIKTLVGGLKTITGSEVATLVQKGRLPTELQSIADSGTVAEWLALSTQNRLAICKHYMGAGFEDIQTLEYYDFLLAFCSKAEEKNPQLLKNRLCDTIQVAKHMIPLQRRISDALEHKNAEG